MSPVSPATSSRSILDLLTRVHSAGQPIDMEHGDFDARVPADLWRELTDLHAAMLYESANAIPSAKPFIGRRVVCAAVRSADGYLILGIRHYSHDMHQQIAAREDGNLFSHRHDDDQGFVDQHGTFMTREEAYQVALRAGQIIRPEACGEGKLYSEGLY